MKTHRRIFCKRLAAAVLAACLLALLPACGEKKLTIEEIRAYVPEMVEESQVLNKIYFGEGFKPDGAAQMDGSYGDYYYTDGSVYGFYSIEQIKEATEAVFTEDYAAILYASAFEGLANGDTVLPPRYIEGEHGLMQSMRATVYLIPEREFDFDSLRILKNHGDHATVAVDTTSNGVVETMRLLVVRTSVLNEDGTVTYTYRLDSPTY